jgi:hypothetical protein
MTTATRTLRFERQPLVHQIAALFETEYGAEYQIFAFTDNGGTHFGVRTGVSNGWQYARFGYADAWRERNELRTDRWAEKDFRRMMTDYLAEDESDD